MGNTYILHARFVEKMINFLQLILILGFEILGKEAMTDCASNGLKGGFGTFNFFVLLSSLVDTTGLDGFTSDNSVV